MSPEMWAGLNNKKMEGNITYQAAAGADVIVSKSPAVLEEIIIGKDVNGGILEVSDSPSDGDGNVKIYLEGNTLMTSCGGSVRVNAIFRKGICADLTTQTNVTFVWRPITV